MLASFSSKAMMTKAKALYGKHITNEQYEELLHKKTVNEIALYLKDNTRYRTAFEGVTLGAMRRGQLESLLHRERFDEYSRLLRYDPSSKGESYYQYLEMQVEVQQILQMIRLLNSGNTQEYITQYPAFLASKACFSFLALANVRSFDDLLEVLQNTPYAKVIMHFRPAADGKIDYTRCEVALRSYYYTHLEQLIDRYFRGRVKRQLHEITQTHIDLINVTTIYRLKRFFPHVDGEFIRSALLPAWKRIPEKELDKLIEAPDADSFIQLLSRSPYASYLGSEDFLFIEYHTESIRYHLNKRYLRFAVDAPTAITAYMVLSEIELNNIITIVEGVRYELPPEEIEKMLIFH